jgi:hypothetical protein
MECFDFCWSKLQKTAIITLTPVRTAGRRTFVATPYPYFFGNKSRAETFLARSSRKEKKDHLVKTRVARFFMV